MAHARGRVVCEVRQFGTLFVDLDHLEAYGLQLGERNAFSIPLIGRDGACATTTLMTQAVKLAEYLGLPLNIDGKKFSPEDIEG